MKHKDSCLTQIMTKWRELELKRLNNEKVIAHTASLNTDGLRELCEETEVPYNEGLPYKSIIMGIRIKLIKLQKEKILIEEDEYFDKFLQEQKGEN